MFELFYSQHAMTVVNHISKMKKGILIAAMSVIVMGASAQTEVNDSILPENKTMNINDAKTMALDSTLVKDSLLRLRPMLTVMDAATRLSDGQILYDNRRGNWEVSTIQNSRLFNPWRDAHVGVSGWADSMPGLLDRESGALTLHQRLGRWTFSASALADKYRFVGMGYLQTQFGIGGTASYMVSNTITLHAFGYYYGKNHMMAGPAAATYLSTSTYGGYADIRISEYVGVDAGVRRYQSPMTGKWVTDPIVSPYIKIGKKQKIGIDFGHLLKGFIWGNREDMIPRGPVRMPPPPGNK